MKGILGFVMVFVTLFSMQSRADIFDAPAPDEQTKIPGALISESADRVLIMIDGYEVESLQQLHGIIAQGLKLPDYYGKNFDALYDVLTDQQLVAKQIDITVIDGAYLEMHIGKRNVKRLLDVLNDAQEADPMHMSTMYWQ